MLGTEAVMDALKGSRTVSLGGMPYIVSNCSLCLSKRGMKIDVSLVSACADVDLSVEMENDDKKPM